MLRTPHMLRTPIVAALVIMAVVLVPATAFTQASADADDHGQQLMQKIHDDLTAKGFTDVRVVPGSFVVSGTDKTGQPVVMLIGPNGMTVLTPQAPQQAQKKDPSLKNWE